MVQRVAVYTRVSTSDQSCERQIAELTAYADRIGFGIVATAKETASGAKNDRAERKKRSWTWPEKGLLTWSWLLSCRGGPKHV